MDLPINQVSLHYHIYYCFLLLLAYVVTCISEHITCMMHQGLCGYMHDASLNILHYRLSVFLIQHKLDHEFTGQSCLIFVKKIVKFWND
jgi:hypothetical protein